MHEISLDMDGGVWEKKRISGPRGNNPHLCEILMNNGLCAESHSR